MVRTAAGLVIAGVSAVLAAGYAGVVTGAVPVDLGVGRRVRALGPQVRDIAAPREVVFGVIAAPYVERQPRAVAEKVRILERGDDMVLAAHRTPVHGGRLTATTVETVRLEPPSQVHFRLVRGPVPHVIERFDLTDDGGATRLEYTGELGTDLWWVGEQWGKLVARTWEREVAHSLESVQAEAERRHSSNTHDRR